MTPAGKLHKRAPNIRSRKATDYLEGQTHSIFRGESVNENVRAVHLRLVAPNRGLITVFIILTSLIQTENNSWLEMSFFHFSGIFNLSEVKNFNDCSAVPNN